MKKSASAFLALALTCALPAFAEGTRTWKQASFEDFEHGTAKGVAIRSDGDLVLAPSFKSIYTSPSTYIWSIASDGEGYAYAAAGSPARVYRIAPDGQATVIFEPKELQVQALVVDTSGVLYAATSPDGKVYKIERPKPPQQEKGKKAKKAAEEETPAVQPGTFTSSVFFDPKTKYIWDLALDASGQLYVATGDRGEVFRVNRSGEGSLFFKSDEAHIRVLSFDTKGNLIAGSDGSGLIYRIAPNGEAFVLYSAPKKEITALANDAAGNIYAAAVGEKRSGGSGSSSSSSPSSSAQITITTTPSSGSSSSGGSSTSAPPPTFSVSAGSDIYRIAADGSPKRIWTSRDDIVYALGFDERGHLLAGTGNKGKIFAVEGESEYTDLLKASANQVTAMAKAPNGGLYISTSNLGKVFVLGAAPDADGTYESDIFDAHNFSRWGRIEVRGRGAYEIFERSGNVDNPDRNWSPWKKVDLASTAEADVPSARFIQWRAVLHSGATPAALQSVTLNYRPNNVAPVVDDVSVQVGMRYQPTPKPSSSDSGSSGPRFDSPPSPIRDRDSIGVRWIAHDDNDDTLSYSIYYRGDKETEWKLLKDKVSDKFYSWDAALFPDGGYTIRIVASDAPSHSPDEALSDYSDSDRFEVDNTPPSVHDLNAMVEAGEFHVTFRATDNYSPIKRAEYSIDAGPWQFIEPVGLISDNRVENYDFSAPMEGVVAVTAGEPGSSRRKGKNVAPSQAPVEHVVVVRVYDRFDNMGSAKVIIHVPR